MGLPYHIGPNKSSLHTTCHQPPNAYSSPQPNFCVNTSSAPNGGPMDFVQSATLPNTAATRFPSHTRHLCQNTRHSTTRRNLIGSLVPVLRRAQVPTQQRFGHISRDFLFGNSALGGKILPYPRASRRYKHVPPSRRLAHAHRDTETMRERRIWPPPYVCAGISDGVSSCSQPNPNRSTLRPTRTPSGWSPRAATDVDSGR